MEVLDGSKVIASANENDPEARQCVLEVGAANGRPMVRDFTLSTSPGGSGWKTIKTVNLPKMSASLHAGFVIYAIPFATNRVHWAGFNHISFTPYE